MKIILAAVFLSALQLISYSGEALNPYFPGEELLYRVTALRFLSAGTALFSVEKSEDENSSDVYILSVEANSSPPFSFFFRVRSRMESFVDAFSLLPVRFNKDRREAIFRRSLSIKFDRDKNMAYYTGEDKSYEVPAGVQDYLSAFYHMRGAELAEGTSFFFTATGGRKNYEVEVKTLRRETVIKWGREVDAFVVQPFVGDFEPGGLVEGAPEMLVWISDDERRIPLRIEMNLTFGKAAMVLINYTQGRKD